MKTIFLLLLFLLTTINNLSAQLKSQVSECFELTSIVFRLAEAPEYINNNMSSYANDIENFFAKYREHKLIHFLKDIREQYGISYDAVAAAAGQLEIKKGKVIIRPSIDISNINNIDERWTEAVYRTFIDLLDDFYRKTKFRNFYLQHTGLYNIAVEKMDKLLLNTNLNWLKVVFKNKLESSLPLVIVSLCNGANNYAFSIDGIEKRNGIVIGSSADRKGLPTYNTDKIYIIIHELLHHYTNNKIESIWDQIKEPSIKIYSQIKEKMEENAYGNPQATMCEWFTNLLTIMYENNLPKNNHLTRFFIKQCQDKGFIWMERSVLFMEHFYEYPDRFVYIDDYIPQIICFIHYTANNFKQILNEYRNRQPYIVDVFPAPGSSLKTDIDNTIQIRFSEPMSTGMHGLSSIEDETIQMPITRGAGWKDKYTYIVPLKKGTLEKEEKYGIQLNHHSFESQREYSIKDDYQYTFNTHMQ